MHESALEKYVREKIKKLGGRAFKWVCPGVTGVPDRICIFPDGRIIFIELKRHGINDGLSARQKKVCRILESMNCTVRRISSKEEFEKLAEEFGYEI